MVTVTTKISTAAATTTTIAKNAAKDYNVDNKDEQQQEDDDHVRDKFAEKCDGLGIVETMVFVLSVAITIVDNGNIVASTHGLEHHEL